MLDREGGRASIALFLASVNGYTTTTLLEEFSLRKSEQEQKAIKCASKR